MIARITGTVIETTTDSVIIEVGRIGYRVFVPMQLRATLQKGADFSLFIHQSVREQSLELFGFADSESLAFFELLLGVSGIGPKSALGILSLADVATLTSAIRAGDTSYLTKVSGIGKKSAERIVLELRDTLGALEEDERTSKDDVDVLEALTALGYRVSDARAALKKVPEETQGTNDRLKEALRHLSN